MKNFNKLTPFLLVTVLASCSSSVEQEVEKSVVNAPKTLKNDHALKGYQDTLQKAKDMEKEVLKATEKKKKIIEDTNK